eukprot:CAMPEP_0185029132 /NCGR_PEP_ID=MMETSP1103-20130426/15255_1 /TAXON_ID=36769 /ORGANISM="Paraphysomonas bandaiensis, Strain Caron Lab Isolate" /LENGTH=224 /DNA_ID=CAMNT_0027563759 /DNA_START=350 /DNA_END=1024 /DNA_ORIENTATION=-
MHRRLHTDQSFLQLPAQRSGVSENRGVESKVKWKPIGQVESSIGSCCTTCSSDSESSDMDASSGLKDSRESPANQSMRPLSSYVPDRHISGTVHLVLGVDETDNDPKILFGDDNAVSLLYATANSSADYAGLSFKEHCGPATCAATLEEIERAVREMTSLDGVEINLYALDSLPLRCKVSVRPLNFVDAKEYFSSTAFSAMGSRVVIDGLSRPILPRAIVCISK